MLIFGVFSSSPSPGVPGSSGLSGVVDPHSEGSSVLEVSEAAEDVVSTDSVPEGSLDSDEDGSSDSEGFSLSESPGSSDSQVSLVFEVEDFSEEEDAEVSPSPPSPGVPGTFSVVVVVCGVVVSEGFSDFTV